MTSEFSLGPSELKTGESYPFFNINNHQMKNFVVANRIVKAR